MRDNRGYRRQYHILPFTAWGVLGGVRCQKEQIPPDLVVKFQAVDIVEVI